MSFETGAPLTPITAWNILARRLHEYSPTDGRKMHYHNDACPKAARYLNDWRRSILKFEFDFFQKMIPATQRQ